MVSLHCFSHLIVWILKLLLFSSCWSSPVLLPGETLKEQQVPRHLPKPSSSFSSSTSRLRDFKETMTNIIRPLSSSSSSSLPAAVLSSELSSSSSCGQHLPATNSVVSSLSSIKPQDWEADSTSGESKSSSSGGAVMGRYRPAWRPRREALNIDTIFTRERRRQAGYSPLGGPPSEGCRAPESEGAVQKEGVSVRPGSSTTLPSSFRGAEIPPPPRLIQRMESGYESSERNSSSPVSLDLNLGDRWEKQWTWETDREPGSYLQTRLWQAGDMWDTRGDWWDIWDRWVSWGTL